MRPLVQFFWHKIVENKKKSNIKYFLFQRVVLYFPFNVITIDIETFYHQINGWFRWGELEIYSHLLNRWSINPNLFLYKSNNPIDIILDSLQQRYTINFDTKSSKMLLKSQYSFIFLSVFSRGKKAKKAFFMNYILSSFSISSLTFEMIHHIQYFFFFEMTIF